MNTFAKTKDGLIHIVFSDNTEMSTIKPETMDLISEDQWKGEYGGYDAEWINCVNYPYRDIVCTDTNISVVRNFV